MGDDLVEPLEPAVVVVAVGVDMVEVAAAVAAVAIDSVVVVLDCSTCWLQQEA
jgi:hypothetical protein